MMNEFYLQEENQRKFPVIFQNSALPSIKLQKFLDPLTYAALQKQLAKMHFTEKKDAMAYSYCVSKKLPIDFNAKEIIALVSKIVDKKIKKIEGTWHRFGWKDYTLLNDESIEKPGIDFMFDAFGKWESDWGGFITYTDGLGNNTTLNASPNTLLLIQRKKGIQKFVKYVNNKAGKNNRYLFLGRII